MTFEMFWSLIDWQIRCRCGEYFAKHEGRSSGEVPALCVAHAAEKHKLTGASVAAWRPQPIADQVSISVEGAVLKHAYRFANGMVASFDERGQQIPELQGTYEEVGEKVRLATVEGVTVLEGFDDQPRQWR